VSGVSSLCGRTRGLEGREGFSLLSSTFPSLSPLALRPTSSSLTHLFPYILIHTAELQKFASSKRLPIFPVPSAGIKKFIVRLSSSPLLPRPPSSKSHLNTFSLLGFIHSQPPDAFLSPSPTTILITASFGSILPPSLLSVFENDRKLNVHPSLLPKYRGASPIQTALMNGDTTTGVSVLGMSEKGTDRGDIWDQKEVVSPIPVSCELATSRAHSSLPAFVHLNSVYQTTRPTTL